MGTQHMSDPQFSVASGEAIDASGVAVLLDQVADLQRALDITRATITARDGEIASLSRLLRDLQAGFIELSAAARTCSEQIAAEIKIDTKVEETNT